MSVLSVFEKLQDDVEVYVLQFCEECEELQPVPEDFAREKCFSCRDHDGFKVEIGSEEYLRRMEVYENLDVPDYLPKTLAKFFPLDSETSKKLFRKFGRN